MSCFVTPRAGPPRQRPQYFSGFVPLLWIRSPGGRFRRTEDARAGSRHLVGGIGARSGTDRPRLRSQRPSDDDRAYGPSGRWKIYVVLGNRSQSPLVGQDGRRHLGRSQLAVFARRVARRPHTPHRALYRSGRLHSIDGQSRSSRRPCGGNCGCGAAHGRLRHRRRADRDRRRGTERNRNRRARADDDRRAAAGQRRLGSGAQGGNHGDCRRVRREQGRPPDGQSTQARDPLDDGNALVFRLGSRARGDASVNRRRHRRFVARGGGTRRVSEVVRRDRRAPAGCVRASGPPTRARQAAAPSRRRGSSRDPSDRLGSLRRRRPRSRLVWSGDAGERRSRQFGRAPSSRASPRSPALAKQRKTARRRFVPAPR